MRKLLKNSPSVREKLEHLPKMYLVAYWAHYGIMEFPFSGKFIYDPEVNDYVPLVYQYDDHNGTCDNWYLRKITFTTTGSIFYWTMSKSRAEAWVNVLKERARNKL